MRVIAGSNNVHTMLMMYKAVVSGPELLARGSSCRNVSNMAVILDARMAPITNFKARNFNLEYAKQEWLWYLRADPKDDSIEQYAKMWAKIKQPDGTYFSNYGQYIFGRDKAHPKSQFSYVVNTLKSDMGSRRASMTLLKREHLFQENLDTVCTYAINFNIEAAYLHMTVMMRSNDVIFGFTNDAFCFWNLYTFVYAMLSDVYPGLKIGNYTHFTNSMHVYDRHYDMIKNILRDDRVGHHNIDVPWPTKDEVVAIVNSKGVIGDGPSLGAYSAFFASE